MTTVGKRITELTKEYIELYETLKRNAEFFEKAEALSLHDLTMKIYIYEEALKQVKVHIHKDQVAHV